MKDTSEAYADNSEAGSASAQLRLGLQYLFGTGVKKNHDLAFEWVRRAAEQGNINAIFWLGLFIERGIGTPCAPHEALELYRLAADSGHSEAMLRMAHALLPANNHDLASAMLWLEKAAAAGNSRAGKALEQLQKSGRLSSDFIS